MIGRTPTPFRGVVAVCRKCSRKLEGGFGPEGEEKLAKALKRGLKAAGRGRAYRVLESGCMGVCPKKAVTVASSGAPGLLLVVERGTGMEEVVAALEA